MTHAIDHNLMHPEDACSGETESAALAVHEAAHAVMSVYRGEAFARVTIAPGDGYHGKVFTTGARCNRDTLAYISAAGPIATAMHLGRKIDQDALEECFAHADLALTFGGVLPDNDIYGFCKAMARPDCEDWQSDTWLVEWKFCASMVADLWEHIVRVAQALEARRTMTHSEVLDLLPELVGPR